MHTKGLISFESLIDQSIAPLCFLKVFKSKTFEYSESAFGMREWRVGNGISFRSPSFICLDKFYKNRNDIKSDSTETTPISK